ncbi:MAG: hypothetical protein JXJ20_15450 [Anaerolineae bacterium]|nr:hypothetical protein [Anaerolineae bacterium]
MKRRVIPGTLIGFLALAASGCGMLRDQPPTPTPIYVTATPELQIVPIVATETPGATSVMAATDVSMLPTEGATRTPTQLPTEPITLTPSFTPSPTDTPVTPNAPVIYGPVGGITGANGEPGTGCATVPQGGFGSIFQSDPSIQAAIGCPLAGSAVSASSAYQTFENGVMIWVSSLGAQPQPAIYALFNNGTYQRYNDTFTDGVDPESSGAAPPPGKIEPVRGFGKVWRENGIVHESLGWATSQEIGGAAQVLMFERGEMVYVGQSQQTYVLVTGAPGTWSARAGGP